MKRLKPPILSQPNLADSVTIFLLQPQLVVSSPTPTSSASTNATISNGVAPCLLDVDSRLSTSVMQGSDRLPVRGASAPELQRSVSDSAEATAKMSKVLLMQTSSASNCYTSPASSAVTLIHDLSLRDVSKL